MTGQPVLDFAILAVSLFNTSLLLWLGLTVFLNAERRSWGIWLASSGLLLGGLFFISHTIILSYGIETIAPGMDLWWRVGWIPVAALPYIWYVVMLWYSGHWELDPLQEPIARKHLRRQRLWFPATSLLGVILLALLLFANPLPSLRQLADNSLLDTPSLAGIPGLVLAYPVYTLVCIGLSVDALRHPKPSGRLMGDLARTRARRWLIAAALMLLLVGLLVAAAMFWIIANIPRGVFDPQAGLVLASFDLVIESLIAFSILLLGRGIVSYEVFTGKSLPRRGMIQYWRRAVILAAGYSLLVAGSLSIQLRPIYSLLLAGILMVTFYALLGWRAYAERERFIENLRPFVSSQKLFENILAGDSPPHPSRGKTNSQLAALNDDGFESFEALCANVLEARRACLFALGPLAPLSSVPLVYPKEGRIGIPSLEDVTSRFESPEELSLQLDLGGGWGSSLAVPLWGARGLIGILILGDKQNGGLYTQEEVEIARATGERVVDARAGAEMARRLFALQRERLVKSQVLDRRTRQVLHDEILPQVHTAMLSLSATVDSQHSEESETVNLLVEVHRQLSDLLRTAPAITVPTAARLGVAGALRQLVDEELGEFFDQTVWEIEPQAQQAADSLPPVVMEVFYLAAREAVRNAARHGRGPGEHGRLALVVSLKQQDGLCLVVEDNGVGLRSGQVIPGARPADGDDEQGSGSGLALHSTMMAVIGGTLSVESQPGAFTRVILNLPPQAW
ncbi:MAG TPA: ATP-binding protein [Anaerolineales bacterium]